MTSRAPVLFGLVAALCLAAAARSAPVRAIRVVFPEGPAAEGLVLERLRLREGMPFDRARVMQDVRELERSGRFSEVRVEAAEAEGGVDLVYTVVLRPRVAEIVIEGASVLTNRKVRDLLGVGVGESVDEALLAAGARRVQDEYLKKYHPDARVTWTVHRTAGTDEASVRVTVKEGRKAVIRAFRFEGNEALPDRQLREGIATRAYRWYNPVHWFTSAGRMDEDGLAGDVFQVRRLYADAGYLDAEVSAPRVEAVGRRRVEVTFQVREGLRYSISAVRIEGTEAVSADELMRVVRLQPGDLASRSAIGAAEEAVLDYYGNRGYIRTSVEPVVEPDAEAGQAEVLFRIREGRIASIRDIRIRGAVQTQDRVARRELVVEPGQQFHRARTRVSEQRLRNLGYFATVYSYPESTPDPDWSDLVFQVEEQRMGQASVGAGFSSIDEFTTFFELSHGNMDLSQWPPVGAGQKLRLRGTLGTKRTDAEIEFIEPYFLDQRLALGINLFHRDVRYESSEYNVRRAGGEVSLSRPVTRFVRARAAYGLEEIDLYDMEDTVSDAIREEEGSRWKSFTTWSLTRETRDQLWAPTRGQNVRASVAMAGGPLGGETDWYRLELMASQYLPLFSTNHVLLVRGRVGVIEEFGDSDRVPIFDRYFLGGFMNIRSFKYREVGPVDEDEEPLGGRSLAFASAEYFYRLHRMVRLSAYWDGGMVWTDAYAQEAGGWNSGVGLGFYLDIPMLPLRFFYAWPLEAEPYNDRSSGVFSFMIGHSF